MACVAYVLIGLYAMVDALLPGRDVTVSSTYGALFGFCVIGLGLTECLYHASLTEAAEAAAWQAEVSMLLCLHLFNAECLRSALQHPKRQCRMPAPELQRPYSSCPNTRPHTDPNPADVPPPNEKCPRRMPRL